MSNPSHSEKCPCARCKQDAGEVSYTVTGFMDDGDAALHASADTRAEAVALCALFYSLGAKRAGFVTHMPHPEVMAKRREARDGAATDAQERALAEAQVEAKFATKN